MNETLKNITHGMCFSGLTYQEANYPIEPNCDRDKQVKELDLNYAKAFQVAKQQMLNPEPVQSVFNPAIGGPHGVGI